jgi:serine/threonine-protein kinase RsbW
MGAVRATRRFGGARRHVSGVLSNVIRHGCLPGQDCDIKVRYTIHDGVEGGIEVEVSDNAKAFDPLLLPPPDLGVPLEQRKVGRLGVFLVRKMMDEVHYERCNGRNHFRFRKRWPAPPNEAH